MAQQVHNLKRKSARERSIITRFSSSIHSFTEGTSRDDYEHYRSRHEEALGLDDTIHDFLTDEEYDADVTNCEEYINAAKRALQRAGHGLVKLNHAAPNKLTPDQTLPLVEQRHGVITP